MKNIGRVLAMALGAASAFAGGAYYWLLRRPLAQTRGALRLQGLSAPVEVYRDRWGVPHIYAESAHDLMVAQGFVHAQDRLWQMDFYRRTAAGRLSEIMGEETVAVDRWLRILGMRRVAEQEVDLLDGDTRAELEAYAAGVNARIEQGKWPVEFSLLRYQPEPWTVADTLSWIKMMSWSLSINWESEILRAQMIEQLGEEAAAELDPPYPADGPRIVPSDVDLSQVGVSALERAQAARPFTGPGAHAGLGSNNWAIAGSRTTTGAPILANDMHLPLSLPAIWYENHLVGGDLNVTGVTFPGIPGIVVGHNGHVAWGFTNGFPDVQDLYMERLRRTDDGRVQYQYLDEWLDATVIREEIGVRDAAPIVEEVVVTRHGPIINPLAPDFTGEQPLALRWTSLEPDTMISCLRGTMRARTCEELRKAMRPWTAPIQNVVCADTRGDIAYSFPGKVPIRARGQGLVPAPGWTGEYEWIGYVPFEELPHFSNPSDGYIATANNSVVSDDYPHFLSHEYLAPDRVRRIRELIEGQERIDVAYVQRMHFDQVSPSARVMAAYLGQLEPEDAELASVVALMRRWDGDLAADSSAAAVYQVFYRRLIRLLLDHRLGDLAVRYAGKGPTPLLAESSMFNVKSHLWLHEILGEPHSPWFDLGGGETRDMVLLLALRQTVDFLKAELGSEIQNWAWGKLHTLTFSHPLGLVPALGKLLNVGPFPIGGDGTTVWATGSGTYDLNCDTVIGPPYRFIADLSDLRNSVSLLAPGQSGQLGSPHYRDQAKAWHTGPYHPMLYDGEDVRREACALLRLLPGERVQPGGQETRTEIEIG